MEPLLLERKRVVIRTHYTDRNYTEPPENIDLTDEFKEHYPEEHEWLSDRNIQYKVGHAYHTRTGTIIDPDTFNFVSVFRVSLTLLFENNDDTMLFKMVWC